MNPSKRQQDGVVTEDCQPVKKPRLPENDENAKQSSNGVAEDENEDMKAKKVRRRKVALLLIYSGWGYSGMQRNPDTKTIEGDLLLAMKKAGFVTEEYFEKPQLMLFQRAARTDKGVSAVRQIVSLKLPEDTDINLINEHLPPQIRVVCMKKTTKGFNSKVNCDARTYSYVLPTYAFSPPDVEPCESFRISKETIQRANQVLENFVGTHNFHNFTLKKNFKDASAIRYMLSFVCGEPFVRDNKEYVTLTVKGQSFMQHHIRKMVGLVIAIMRGCTGEETIKRAFDRDPLDIPKAPGLGLMLEEVHYENYNRKYGNDGVHAKLEWSEHEQFIRDFKDKHIYENIFRTEVEEKSMLTWMAMLSAHSYSVRVERPSTINPSPLTGKEKDCAAQDPDPKDLGVVTQEVNNESGPTEKPDSSPNNETEVTTA